MSVRVKKHARVLEGLQDSYRSQSKLHLSCEALIDKSDTYLNSEENKLCLFSTHTEFD